jgi:peroxidase
MCPQPPQRKNVHNFSSSSVSDIDLFSGGLSESPVDGGIVGPTFACLIANQFKKLKKCDRFWHETNDSDVGFTEGQLQQIRNVTLAAIVCRNCDVGTPIQKYII